jgi:formylglycine-generating enzyme required for sulfatase activity
MGRKAPPPAPAPRRAAKTPRPWLRLALVALVALGCGTALGVAFRDRPEPSKPAIVPGDGITGPVGMVRVPGGEFLMGSDHRLAQPNERPAHRVRVGAFWMDQHHVTNAEFRRFVAATGYVTTAERKPSWNTLKVQLAPQTAEPSADQLVPGAMVFVGTERPVPLDDYSQWWRFMPGASWKHPQGPGSTIDGKDDHPVVQVSYEDVLAYASWIGKRLPTEAEWEFAARGGLDQATYAWGDEFEPRGTKMLNFWDTRAHPFPVVSAKAGGAMGTSPAGTFPANGYGLYDMTGNAWQWVADWYRADAFARQVASNAIVDDPRGPDDSWDPADRGVPEDAPRRVVRGGSFLCNVDYCLSYRPSARRGNDPYNPMSHIGFRLVMSVQDWERSRR